MITTATHFQARNPATLYAGAPKLSIRPAHTVLGWTAEQVATFNLARDRNNLAMAEAAFASACAALGTANRAKSMRRHWQAQAMRRLNGARATLRQARAALAASLAAAPALAA